MKNEIKNFLFVICYLLFAQVLFAQDNFYLVESVPVETVLEQSKLPRAADVWLEMINGAKTSLDIETFYIANEKGEVLEKILKAVKDAAGRGVKVRIIIDEGFYKSSEKSADELDNIPNITLRKINFKKIAGGVMHAKYFVVDKYDLFLGSQNMDWRALRHIHEMGVRVKNEKIAKSFMNIFEIDWQLCEDSGDAKLKELKKKYSKDIISYKNPVKINSTDYGAVKLYPAFSPGSVFPSKYSKEITELIKIIKKAKSSICIQVMTYSLKGESKEEEFDKIDKALRDAAARGVKVKIIFSNWAIKKGATESIQDLSAVPNIEIKFSSIPEYSGGFIPYSRVDHCKYLIADSDVSWVSTSNWDRGYFFESRNATMIIQSKKVNTALEEVFSRVWNSSLAEKVETDKVYQSVKRK